MKFTKSSEGESGPSSAIGIMRFNTESGGPKLRPEFVIGLAVVFSVIVLAIQLLAPVK